MTRVNVWIVLLLVSVLVNGILLGAGARIWFAPDRGPGIARDAGLRGFNLRAFVTALPEEHRREVLERARTERRALGADFRAVARARREAFRALSADEFDALRITAALEEARAAEARIESRTEAIILDVTSGVGPQERRAALRAAMDPRRFEGRFERAPARPGEQDPGRR